MMFTLCTAVLALAQVGEPEGLPPVQTLTQVVDINAVGTAFSSEVRNGTQGEVANNRSTFVSLGDHWYFTAESLFAGRELWRTDGTQAGTSLVLDIFPGTSSSEPDWLTVHNDRLYFVADDGVHGRELWSSDGTASGTSLAVDIFSGANESLCSNLMSWNGQLLFWAESSGDAIDEGLWTSDGTPASTQLIKTFTIFDDGPFARNFARLPGTGKLFFLGRQDATGEELWSTDGTTLGTNIVADIVVGPDSSSPEDIVTWNGKIYFSASTPALGVELWSSDGTELGTVALDINPGAASSSPSFEYSANFNGALYFRAYDDVHGDELWKTDGTELGTELVEDTALGIQSGFPTDLVVHAGDLYFVAQKENEGRSLRRLTTGGLVEVITEMDNSTGPRYLTSFNGNLFFQSDLGTGVELGVSDGTATGTALIDVAPGFDFLGAISGSPRFFTPIGPTALMFTAFSPDFGTELWVTDGTALGTSLLAECDDTVLTDSSEIRWLTTLDGRTLTFTAFDGFEWNLYSWDPQVGVATPLAPGQLVFDAPVYAWIDGQSKAFFDGNSSSNPMGLSVTDGTPEGTLSLLNISVGDVAYSNGRVYFPANGAELWSSDGTSAGTSMVADIVPGSTAFSNRVRYITPFNDKVVFLVDDFSPTDKLWVSDGTAAGTMMVADVGVESGVSFEEPLFPVGDVLIFQFGGVAWRTDGTRGGTLPITNTELFVNPNGITALSENSLIMSAYNPLRGFEPWVSNVMPGGMTFLADINPNDSSFPRDFTRAGDVVFFSADDGTNGRELWKTDGTPIGTVLVADLNSGPEASSPDNFIAAGNGCYFTAFTPSTGREVFFTDGTSGGTVLAADTYPGETSGDPSDYVLLDGDLYFQATHPAADRELFRLSPAGAYSASLGVSSNHSRLTAGPLLLGGSWDITLANTPPGTMLHWLTFSVATDTATAIPGGAPLWIDFAQFFVIPLGPSDYDLSGIMPSDTALAGIRLNLQDVALPSKLTSNAVTSSIGF